MSTSNTVQLTLRVPPWLRERLNDRAEADRRSANTTAVMILEQAMSEDGLNSCSKCGGAPVYIGSMCRDCYQAAQGRGAA